MRSVDLGKSWPFDAGENPKERLLPPMPIRKFRWWSDELKLLEKANDDEVPLVKAKGKQRTPKKRSIVEIFAVAPPIEAVDGEEEGKAKRKKKKKKKLKIEICAKRKEKTHKPKSPSLGNTFLTLEDSVHKGLSGKKSDISVNSWKKPSCMKNLPRKRSFKLLCNSKFLSKSRKKVSKVIPVHSILKKSSRGVVKKASRKLNKHGDPTIKSCRKSTKRVTFSGKDDIIGHNESCPNIDLPQFQSLCKIFSRVLAASSALGSSQKGDKLPAPIDVQVENVGATTVVTSGSEGDNGSLSEKEQLSVLCTRDIPMYTCPENLRCSSAERSSIALPVDLNDSVQTCSDMDQIIPETSAVLSGDRHAGDPRVMNCSNLEGLCSHSILHVEETFPRPSDACFIPNSSEKFLSVSSPTCSQIIVGSPRQYLSTSCVEQNGKKLLPSVQPMPMPDSCFHNLDYQANHNLSSKDLIRNMSSPVIPRLTSQPVPAGKDKHIGEDYIGLPLNSQGELIRLKSGANFGFSELFKQHNAVQSSMHSFPAPNRTDPRITAGRATQGKFPGAPSSCFQEHNYHVGRPEASGFGFSRASERREVQSYEPLKTNGQLFYHGYREEDHTRNYIDRVKFQAEGNFDCVPQPAMQRTMRLMGKNVTVGRKEHQGHDDGRIWTDKEVITDNCHSVRVSNIPLPKQWLQQEWVTHSANGTSKDNLFWPLEAPSNFSLNPGTGSRVGLMHSEYRPQWMSRNGVSSSTRDHSFKVDLLRHPFPSQALPNKTSNSTMYFKPGTASVDMGYQKMPMTSNPPTYPNMLLSSAHCKHIQGVAYSTSSNVQVPFSYCNNQSSLQPSPIYSTPNLSEWLLTPRQQKTYLETSGPSHPNTLPGSNFFTPPPTPIIPFSVYTTNNSCESTTPAVVQPSLAHVPATGKSNSVAKDACTSKNKGRGRTQLNFTYLRSLDTAGKTIKRPAEDDVFVRPAKKILPRIQEDINPSDSARTKESVSESFRISSASSSLNLDGDSRTGPIKLSAGAKHILKPSQGMDQDDARPIHSTEPLSFGSTSSRILDSQKKPAKVYRF